MILGGLEIKKRQEQGDIIIDPFDESCLGPNSYDIHLGDNLYVYADCGSYLDPEKLPPLQKIEEMEGGGWILQPGVLYLASTKEYTETHGLVPMIEGRSSIGRLGIFIHATAGFGDVGFKGNWTLEISAVHRVRICPGVRIGQIFYHTICGDYKPYSGRYLGDRTVAPSRLSAKTPTRRAK